MSELEQRDRDAEKPEDASAAYTTTAVGVGLLVAAVLIITAGTPAAGIGFVIGAAACLGWSIPKLLQHKKAPPPRPRWRPR